MNTVFSRREFLAMSAALTANSQQLSRTKRDWSRARAKTLIHMQAVMGKLPSPVATPMENTGGIEQEFPTYTSQKYFYNTLGVSEYVPAYVLIPKPMPKTRIGILCLHQTTKIGKDEPAGLGGNPNLHYARELAERGFITIAPDYPYLGENHSKPYEAGYQSCTMLGVVNHIRAVNVLQILGAEKIGVIGHSLGGHNALFVAAFDKRIDAVVTSCGFTKFSKYFNGNLKGWAGERYMPLIEKKYGNDPQKMPFDFPEILTAIAPRAVFINAPLHDGNFEVSGVQDCVAAAMPVYDKIFKAKEKLIAVYPDAGHDFPNPIRQQAYQFLARWLR